MRGEVSTNIIYCELQKKTDMLHELYPIELKKKVQKNFKKNIRKYNQRENFIMIISIYYSVEHSK